MAILINTNFASLNAQRYVAASGSVVQACLQRLSSGLRIGSARDDAAGMAIASRMTSQINGAAAATRNANDAISMLQTAEGAMASVSDSLQRMRQLAVQAANGTNNAADRRSLNEEMQQLSAEIDRIANVTSFNGLKLLDGTFGAQSFQVGANAGDVIQVASIKNMDTSGLGSTGSTFQAKITGSAVVAALGDGGLILNGTSVGASQAGAAAGQDDASAFAVAAAINAVSLLSNVTAAANPTVLKCGVPRAFGAIAAGSFAINGTTFGAIVGDGTAAGQGAALAAAIASAEGATGVTATADASGAVTLTAADGRNIDIDMPNIAANAAAAAADKAALLSRSGFASAAVGTEAVLPVAARNDIAFSIPLVVADAGKTVTINGVLFTIADSAAPSAVVDAHHVALNIDITGGGGSAAGTAASLLGAITTAQGDPLTAAALGTVSANNTAPGTIELTDVTAGSSTTAISSTVSGTAITRPVSGVAGVPASTGATRGTVTLTGSGKDGMSVAGADPASAGLSAAHVGAAAVATMVGIDTLDLLTVDNAQNAISSLDSALQSVALARGALGAYQSRFASAIANLQNAGENLSASRSRIEDADYAAETAALTRALVLQRASVGILAQANSTSRQVLSLLKR